MMMMAKNSAKGNIDPDDNRAAQIAEKHPLDEKDQQTAIDQVVQDGRGGDADQRGAIVERHEFDAGRQAAVAVDLFDLVAHTRHHIIGVQRAVHDDDGVDHVVLMIAAALPSRGTAPTETLATSLMKIGTPLDCASGTFSMSSR